MSSSVAICPTCKLRLLVSTLLVSNASWKSNTTRGMASAMRQKKKPARMLLSQDILQSGEEVKARPRTREGPFAGMNRTDPGAIRRSNNVTRRSSSLEKRQQLSRGKPVLTPKKGEPETEVRRDHKSDSNVGGSQKKDDRPLFHALKMQQTLTPHMTYGQKDKLKDKLEKIQAFEELGLSSELVNAVYSQAFPGLTTYSPSPIQKLAIPILVQRNRTYDKPKVLSDPPNFEQFLLAAETGSGKTLAYLLPVINGIKLQEEADQIIAKEEEAQKVEEKKENQRRNVFEIDPTEDTQQMNPDMGRPRALILLPSSELVSQVGKVVKSMSHVVKYRSAPISAANSPTVIRNRLFNRSGIDILISTPHLLSSIAEKDPNILSRVQYIVVDEADSLLDRSFSSITCGLIDRAAPSLKQLILSSATIPRSLDTFLDKRFPQVKRLVTPKLHTISRRVQLGVIDIERDPYRGRRDLACADIIWQLGKATHDDASDHHTMKSILVFVNERDQAEELAKFLVTKGIDAAPLTRDTSEQRQSDVLSAFTSANPVAGSLKPPTPESDDNTSNPRRDSHFVPFEQHSSMSSAPPPPQSKPTRFLPNTKVLVSTDLGSRGIDTLAVRHVVLYDVPHTTIDFVHRLGRAGRFNRRGRGVVLVGKHDRKDVVREVRDAMFRGQALI